MSNTLSKLSPHQQLEVLADWQSGEKAFSKKLSEVGLWPLKPTKLDILQINLGYMCNQQCSHCHVDASPYRKEIMTKEVLESCLNVIDLQDIKTVDLTGGAPEMNPNFEWLLNELSKRKVEVIVRSNLTILVEGKFKSYPQLFKAHRVTVISSLPCYTESNVDKQRGDGVFNKSIKALNILNELGYGKEPGLKLHLVYNPGGPSVAPDQHSLEADYKRELKENYNIDFNSLYTITNLPIARFLEFLLENDRYESYMELLYDKFNPVAAEGVMCRNTLSVDWNGDLFDCDFNQMLQLPVTSKVKNIKDFSIEALQDRNIVVNNHCYGCTAGAGSSCQGAII
ncbi:MAG: arsenosugar biosynthesis radical SAM protein ArsS [Crocinitomicaceae bacterium]|nr:arsenosugar biosynthesis radical SAM protein ArsS [Crocinitomicaceae bacterium]